jgi:hypothetical protein
LAVGSLEDRAKKDFEVKDDKLPGRPIIDHDIEGGGEKGKKDDSDSRSGAKKKFKLFG